MGGAAVPEGMLGRNGNRRPRGGGPVERRRRAPGDLTRARAPSSRAPAPISRAPSSALRMARRPGVPGQELWGCPLCPARRQESARQHRRADQRQEGMLMCAVCMRGAGRVAVSRFQPRASARGHITTRMAAIAARSCCGSLEQAFEVGDGFLEAIGERDLRLPAEQRLRLGDVGLALARVVLRQRPRDDARERDPVSASTFSASSRMVNSLGLPRLIGPVTSSPLAIRRIRPSIRSSHVAERARLAAVAVDGESARRSAPGR